MVVHREGWKISFDADISDIRRRVCGSEFAVVVTSSRSDNTAQWLHIATFLVIESVTFQQTLVPGKLMEQRVGNAN